jgi:medium-chain acyl-[acyl-carrier-protein] hydrolase
MLFMNLFCIPYAGGSANLIFKSWQAELPATIRVIPMELPGHGSRMKEPRLGCVSDVVADLLPQIRAAAADSPYAIYGHSMGTLIAYELIKAIGHLRK